MSRVLNAGLAFFIALGLAFLGHHVEHDAPFGGAALFFLAGLAAFIAFVAYEPHPHMQEEAP